MEDRNSKINRMPKRERERKKFSHLHQQERKEVVPPWKHQRKRKQPEKGIYLGFHGAPLMSGEERCRCGVNARPNVRVKGFCHCLRLHELYRGKEEASQVGSPMHHSRRRKSRKLGIFLGLKKR